MKQKYEFRLQKTIFQVIIINNFFFLRGVPKNGEGSECKNSAHFYKSLYSLYFENSFFETLYNLSFLISRRLEKD